MKKITLRRAALAVAVLLTALAMAACTKPETPVLTMGTNAEFPPFEFVADNNEGLVGQFDGVDVALAKKIAEELGYELKIDNMAFDALIMALESGKIDFIAAGMTATDERRLSVDFTDTYFKAVQYIIVRQDNSDILTVDDLNGKVIGVQQGTTGDFISSDDLAPADVKRYARGIDAVLDLKSNKIDAIVIDSMPATVFVNTNTDLKLIKAQSMVVKSDTGDIASIDDIYGKSIGVLAGSVGESVATEIIADAAITAFGSLSEAAAGLNDGTVDVLLLDGLDAESLIAESDGFSLPENNDVFGSLLFEAEDYAIAVKKDNSDLLNKMNGVIEKMKTSGEINDLVTKYSE